MRHIRKHCSVELMIAWCLKQLEGDGGEPTVYWDSFGGEEKRALRECLLREQGWICAYTGHAITRETSHIEHLRPRSECRTGPERRETVDGSNLVACCPGPRGELSVGTEVTVRTNFPYVAFARGDRNGERNRRFLKPTEPEIAQQFQYRTNGKICGNSPDADYTIEVLKLDHPQLCDHRKKAIDAITEIPDDSDFEHALSSLDVPDTQGRLTPFCFVLSAVFARRQSNDAG